MLRPELRRLDLELVARGLARSRGQAQEMISSGGVRVDGVVTRRAAARVDAASVLEAAPDHYVSRAAHKLAGALDDLGLAVPSRALDAGASTGGFTQVLLERGCREVIAVDVGTDQLAAQLRDDPRVRSLPQTNLRDLTLAHLDDKPVDLVVADVSFISLTLLVGPLLGVTAADGELLLLVKPQFEVGRERLGSGWCGARRGPSSAGGGRCRRVRGAPRVDQRRGGSEPDPGSIRQHRALRAAPPARAVNMLGR